MGYEGWESQLLAEVAPLLRVEHTGHDLAHMLRVRRLALAIAAREGGDRDVLSAAALLHDLYRDDPANADKSKAADYARAALERCGFPAGKVDGVLGCITGHSWSQRESYERSPATLEMLIFRDADRLDAIGAWGIARTFAYGGAHSRPLGGDLTAEGSFKPTAASSDMSTVAHFHQKLLTLAENMNTRTARQLAAARHGYLTTFLATLQAEAEGELLGDV